MAKNVTRPAGNVRKAAVLIACLDHHSAERLFEQMGPEAAQRVRHALAELGEVSPEEQQRVMEEFLRVGPMVPQSSMGGIELDDSLARRLAAAQASYRAQNPVATATDANAPATDAPPFRFLHEAAGETLAAFLRHEHPQTVAVVVSHLQPRRAADLLGRLDGSLQVDVLRRIAELDEADPEVVRDVERELHSLLSNEIRTVQRRSAGLAAVSAILAAAEQSERRDILANLAERQPQFAATVDASLESPGAATRTPTGRTFASVDTPPTLGTTPRSLGNTTQSLTLASTRLGTRDSEGFPASIRSRTSTHGDPSSSREERTAAVAFADLAQLDPRDWSELLQAVDPPSLLLALSGAPSELLRQLSSQLSPRERKALDRKLTALGPMRLRDVDRAQQRVVEAATELMSRGKIRLAGEGRALSAA